MLKDIKFKEKVITNLKKAAGEKLGEKKCDSCDSSVGELQYDGSFICSRCDIVDYSEKTHYNKSGGSIFTSGGGKRSQRAEIH